MESSPVRIDISPMDSRDTSKHNVSELNYSKPLVKDEEAPEVIKCSIKACPNSLDHQICDKCEMVVDPGV